MSENLADKQKAGPAKMADEAVVPQVSHIAASMMPPGPYNAATPHLMQNMTALFDQFNSVKPQLAYDHPGMAMMQAQGALAFPGIPLISSGVVPQLNQQLAAKRLTAAQQSELEMARRRAQKAAEGKRANATAARRAKRKALGQPPRVDPPIASPIAPLHKDKDSDDPDDDGIHGDEDLEARLAASTSEKESKRLKRLLRNRVSAQQARERKKQFVSNLETKNKAMEQELLQVKELNKKLQRDNDMLRQVIKNMKPDKTQ